MTQNNHASLSTVPNSLREQLDRAQNLFAQSHNAATGGDEALAMVRAIEGLRVMAAIAQRSPACAALVLCAQMGYRGFEFEEVERVDNYQVVPDTFLGFTIGHDIINVPTIIRRTYRGSIY